MFNELIKVVRAINDFFHPSGSSFHSTDLNQCLVCVLCVSGSVSVCVHGFLYVCVFLCVSVCRCV